MYRQRREREIDGGENCEVNSEAQRGFISGRGRGGKVSSGQNRRRRKGEWGEWCSGGGGRKCAVEKTAEQSVAASDSGKTMMSAATGPTSKLLHTYTSPPRQLCPYTTLTSPSPYFHSPSSSFFPPTLPSFPFLSFPFFPSNLLPTTGLPILPRCPAYPLCER